MTMKTIEMIYLWAQVVFSVLVILFGVSYAVRCFIENSGGVYVFLFVCLAINGYALLYRASIKELREAREKYRKGEINE